MRKRGRLADTAEDSPSLLWHYDPYKTLACPIILLHSSVSRTLLLQPTTHISLKSPSTFSHYLLLGPPLLLTPASFLMPFLDHDHFSFSPRPTTISTFAPSRPQICSFSIKISWLRILSYPLHISVLQWSINSQNSPVENTKVFVSSNLTTHISLCICYYRSDYRFVYFLFDIFWYIPRL